MIDNHEVSFDTAADRTFELVDNLERDGLEPGSALAGALTVIFMKIIEGAPDSASALALISHCLGSAVVGASGDELMYESSSALH